MLRGGAGLCGLLWVGFSTPRSILNLGRVKVKVQEWKDMWTFSVLRTSEAMGDDAEGVEEKPTGLAGLLGRARREHLLGGWSMEAWEDYPVVEPDDVVANVK